MRRIVHTAAVALFACAASFGAAHACGGAAKSAAAAKPGPEWSMNATIIEACSCPMFCQCYFATKPASHAAAAIATDHQGHDHAAAAGSAHSGHDMGGGEHYCRFNNAYKVNSGSYGDVKLDGAKFWVAGDLGDEFSDGEMDWAILTFDPAVTPAQREGIAAAVGALYPVKWKSFAVAPDAAVHWEATKDVATAKLGDGKMAEVVLRRNTQRNTDAPIVISNLKYWGAPRNDGFLLMQNEIEAYRGGEKPFEYKGTNGFMITFDINSKDAASAASAAKNAKM
jgi:hypothetical protein